jgi:hypothetical protein
VDSLDLQEATTPPDLINGGHPVEFRSVKMSRTMFRPTVPSGQHAQQQSVPNPVLGGGGGGGGGGGNTVRRSLFGGDPSSTVVEGGSTTAAAAEAGRSVSPGSGVGMKRSRSGKDDAKTGGGTGGTNGTDGTGHRKKMSLKSRTDVTNDASTPDTNDSAYSQMPLYRGLVKRSTRFTTTVPAVQVLRLIHEIIENTPQKSNNEIQNVSVDFETYRLEVTRGGGKRLCRVRIFLMKAGLYMVEFLRDQLDIFQFKRFYENIRAKLSAIVKKDHSLQLLASHRPHVHNNMSGRIWRKRSHSV